MLNLCNIQDDNYLSILKLVFGVHKIIPADIQQSFTDLKIKLHKQKCRNLLIIFRTGFHNQA